MLEHIFGSKTRLKLLKIFFAYPERSFYVRELTRLCESQINGVRREIANLETLGIIVRVSGGEKEVKARENIKSYRLQTGFLLYQELKDLIDKAQMLEEREFVDNLKAKAGKIKLMLLSGYFTQENDAPTDLLLVGEIKESAFSKIFQAFEKNIGKELRYTIFSEKEFLDRKEMGDKFLYNLLERRYIKVTDDYQFLS
ncbi:MAG TPA: hypothetical protein P5230_01160 [Candidatus Magasanikbacteria bacterium]|nr:hypothetical protein [Candidatus Magasanikbacteria bacterium]